MSCLTIERKVEASSAGEVSSVAVFTTPIVLPSADDECLRSGVELHPTKVTPAKSRADVLPTSTPKLCLFRDSDFNVPQEEGPEFRRIIVIPFESQRWAGTQNSIELLINQRFAATRNLAFQDKVREEAEQSVA